MYIYYLLLDLLPSLWHILYFDAAKFSIKQFSLIYLTVSVVRQRNEYEIVIKMQPIKITEPAFPSKVLICTKIKSLKGSAMSLNWQHCASPFLQLRVRSRVKQKICSALIAR